MDETSSTTFVLFDRIVAQFIGRSVKDLIAEMNKVPKNCSLRWKLVMAMSIGSGETMV